MLAAAALGCVPSFGPFSLEAARGQVVDRQSGAPIAGAEVFQWYRGAGRGGGPQPVYHARWVTADARGRFAFDDGSAPSPRMWLLKTYGPSYSFFHPGYGLQHGAREGPEGGLRITGDRERAEQAHAELRPYCRGERDDAGARRLAAIACAPRPSRPPG